MPMRDHRWCVFSRLEFAEVDRLKMRPTGLNNRTSVAASARRVQSETRQSCFRSVSCAKQSVIADATKLRTVAFDKPGRPRIGRTGQRVSIGQKCFRSNGKMATIKGFGDA